MRLFLSPVDRIGLAKQAKLEFRGRLGRLHQKRVDVRRSRVVNPWAARERGSFGLGAAPIMHKYVVERLAEVLSN
jgi:hypothetical protein